MLHFSKRYYIPYEEVRDWCFANMGAYAPTILKCILHGFRTSEKLKRKIYTYIFTCVTPTATTGSSVDNKVQSELDVIGTRT
jgi:hypothetical protein